MILNVLDRRRHTVWNKLSEDVETERVYIYHTF